MKLFNIIRNFIFICFEFVKLTIVSIFCVPIVEVLYGGFWNYRAHLIKSNRIRTRLYDMYLELNCASIGLKSKFTSKPIMPHGLHGIHISDGAVLGKDVTIMQNVTIGSNTLSDSKRNGAPHLGDNVFIGANATVIGGITVGNNCRIGANCCVYMNLPDNHTVVVEKVRCIPHKRHKENKFISMQAFENNDLL